MSPGPTTQDGLIRALPVLVHIQTHLEADLTLEILAEKANLSPYYFHRIFRSATGETPKQYTQRLRLERAAYHLKTRDASILDIALSAGFRSPETFSRAFKRHFQRSPSAFRRAHRPDPSPGGETSRKSLNRHAAGYEISSTTVQNIRPLPVAFLRNHGPYRTVDVGLYDRLGAIAQSRAGRGLPDRDRTRRSEHHPGGEAPL